MHASSTRDPLLMRFIQEYPPYELPAGLSDEDGSLESSGGDRVPGRALRTHSLRPSVER